MVRNTEKRAEQKAFEIQEMEMQLEKGYFCGSCSVGFQTVEEYKEHCEEEEHNYHITRRIESLVPGLGFCPSCSCLIQTAKGWESHADSVKHNKCIDSLNAIGIQGDYSKPLGCTVNGELGGPIDSVSIDQKVSARHGYGHGGKLGKNVPLIGLNHVKELKVLDRSEQPKYHCDICDVNFTFEHRSKHLTGMEHRTKYLEKFYAAWHEDISTMDSKLKTTKLFRLMWYAYNVEKLEKDEESETAKALRHKFVNEVTKKKEHNQLKAQREQIRVKEYYDAGYSDSFRSAGPRSRARPLMGGRSFPRRGAPSFRGHPMQFGPRHNLPVSTLPNHMRPRGPPRNLMSRNISMLMEDSADFGGGYCGDLEQAGNLGKRPSQHDYQGRKKYKEDPYAAAGTTNQLDQGGEGWDASEDPYEEKDESQEFSKALEAIEVLENFAMSKAKESIKERIDAMKTAVLTETGRGGVRGRGPRPRGSGGMGKFPPRPNMMPNRGFHPHGPPRGMGPPFGMPMGGPPRNTLPNRGGFNRGRGRGFRF